MDQANIPLFQVQQAMSHLVIGQDEAVEQARNPQLLQQQHAQLGIVPIQGGSQAIPNTEYIMRNKQALQQLIKILRTPQSPDQQQQVLQILQSHPQLMAAFIKRRQQQQARVGPVPIQGSSRPVKPSIPAIRIPRNIMMQKLRSPQSPAQQQQILQILRSDSQFWAAFTKHQQTEAQGAGAGVVEKQQ